MTGHSAILDTFTTAELSRLRETLEEGSFEIRDCLESRRSKDEKNAGRKTSRSFRKG